MATINTLAVETATVNGELRVEGLTTVASIVVNGHIITNSGQPSSSSLAAAGSESSVAIDGNDTAGTITITTGSNPTAGELLKLLFSENYTKAPRVIIGASNETVAGLQYYKGVTTLECFVLNARDVPTANTEYRFDYFIVE